MADLDVEFYEYETDSATWAIEKRAQMRAYLTDTDAFAYYTVGEDDRYIPLLDENFDTVTAIRHIALNTAGSIGLGSAKGRLVFNDASTDNAQFLTCNVSVGNVTADNLLHVWSASAGAVSAHANSYVVIESDDHAGLEFLVPTNKNSRIYFSDSATARGAIVYDHVTDLLEFSAAGGEKINIGENYSSIFTELFVNPGGSTHTDPDSTLHLYEGDAGLGAATSGTVLTLEVATDSHSYISILNPSGEGYYSGIIFGHDAANNASIIYDGYSSEMRINVESGNDLDFQIDDSTKFYISSSGIPCITGSDLIFETERTITNANDTGTAGTMCCDDNYIYFAIGTDTWKRAAISTW